MVMPHVFYTIAWVGIKCQVNKYTFFVLKARGIWLCSMYFNRITWLGIKSQVNKYTFFVLKARVWGLFFFLAVKQLQEKKAAAWLQTTAFMPIGRVVRSTLGFCYSEA